MQPLMVNPATNNVWLPQSANGIIQLNRNDRLRLICHDDFRAPFAGNKQIVATCKNQQTFSVNGVDHLIETFECRSYYPQTLRNVGESCAKGDGTLAEIGHDIGGGSFLRTMAVCLNNDAQFTYHVQYNLYPGSDVFQQRCKQTNFATGPFFGGVTRTFANYYAHNSIVRQFAKLLGPQSSTLFEGVNLYFSPGHLMPRTDNMLATDQLCTYYYINAAQQWHSFNSGKFCR